MLLTTLFAAPLFANPTVTWSWNPNEEVFVRGEPGDEIAVVELDNVNFAEFIKQNVAVIKFYADWCGPCQRFRPKFEHVAASEEFAGVVGFGALNVSTSSQIANKCRVKKVPTIVIFSQGTELKRHEGSLSEEPLKKFILSALNG